MFDAAELSAAIARHGPVVRVVVARVQGSAPREVGTAMLVWASGQQGTIGGGALEWQAVQQARALLPHGGSRISHHPLGPALGQCCGGAVTLVTEVYHAAPTGPVTGPVIARSLDGSPLPLAVKRRLAAARGQGVVPAAELVQGWMIEPTTAPDRPLWIWGAGHVGRALVDVLAPLPGFAITWVDVAPDRFPADSFAPDSFPSDRVATEPKVRILPVPDPASAVPLAPQDAEHLILTFSHALDLDLCHRLLTHGFAACGLIGSASKWARFRHRLTALGHAPDQIARIICPIGSPALGKHPHAIAIGVAAALLAQRPRVGHFENLFISKA